MAPDPSLTGDLSRSRGAPVVTDLVARAGNGGKQAWDALVERYALLVWSICRRYQLDGADAADIGQSVWLELAGQLGDLRDPAALAGWLAATTRRECGRILRHPRGPRQAGNARGAQTIPDGHARAAEQELPTADRQVAVREAFSHLPPSCQQLIALLTEDPPLSYAQISAKLGTPVGSIGPNRRRCLDQLRRHPAIAALIDADTKTAT